MAETRGRPGLGGVTEKRRRRIRHAIYGENPTMLNRLFRKGIDVNMPLSKVVKDTPLTLAVKHGKCEIVECLIKSIGCDVNKQERYKYSPLDVALAAWYFSLITDMDRTTIRARGRILRSLLGSGADNLSAKIIDVLLECPLNPRQQLRCIGHLLRIVCDHKIVVCATVKNGLLAAMLMYKHTNRFVEQLLLSGASVDVTSLRDPGNVALPLETAIILVKATNDPAVLQTVELWTRCYIFRVRCPRLRYQHLIRILVLCGHQLQLTTVNMFRPCHARLYNWVAKATSSPMSLTALSRITLRSMMLPNVFFELKKSPYIPPQLQKFILLEQL